MNGCIIQSVHGGGDCVNEKKVGRPKSTEPTRSKSITIKMTVAEFEELKTVCYNERLAYVDILLLGLKSLPRKWKTPLAKIKD